MNSLPEEEALSLCFAGVELYRGDFLPKAGVRILGHARSAPITIRCIKS